MARQSKTELFYAVCKALDRHPVDEVIPVLITASARALLTDANGDLDKLANKITKFNALMLSQVTDMMNEDLAEAHEATKQ